MIYKEIRVQYMLPHNLHEELEKLPLIFIPLAPLEWHGLHLVIGTDPINAEHVALEVAKRVGGVVLPTLYMGTERERDPKTLESLGFDKSDYVVGMNFFKAKGLYESFYFSEEIFALVLRAHIELCIDHRYRYIYIISEKNRGQFSVLFSIKGYSITGGSVVLDRKVVGEFLDEELKEIGIPDDIFKEALVEAFCKYVEDDYYEWLKDNFKSFFNYGKSDWKWERERIKKCGR